MVKDGSYQGKGSRVRRSANRLTVRQSGAFFKYAGPVASLTPVEGPPSKPVAAGPPPKPAARPPPKPAAGPPPKVAPAGLAPPPAKVVVGFAPPPPRVAAGFASPPPKVAAAGLAPPPPKKAAGHALPHLTAAEDLDVAALSPSPEYDPFEESPTLSAAGVDDNRTGLVHLEAHATLPIVKVTFSSDSLAQLMFTFPPPEITHVEWGPTDLDTVALTFPDASMPLDIAAVTDFLIHWIDDTI
jgi:hypothetical protein